MSEPRTTARFGIAAVYVFVFAGAFWLLFYNLDGRLLWADEAETAVLARNVMRFGVPKTVDGTNYILFHGTIYETRDHVWVWSPWVQEYVAAGAFKIFGTTTWAARAPFAFMGWGCLAALAFAAWKIYRSHWIALGSVALLGTSEIFLLHARQCRYYTIGAFTEILLVYGIYQLFTRNRRGILLAAAALVLQFYSNYILAAANMPAFLFLAWMFRRRGGQAVLDVVAIPGILFVAALPWLAYANPWGQGGFMGGEDYPQKIGFLLKEFHFHFVPLCFLLLPLPGLLPAFRAGQTIQTPDANQWENFLLVLLPSYFAVIVMAPGPFLRYLLPLLPLSCLLATVWIFRYIKWPLLAIAVTAVLCASNAFSVLTAYPVRGKHTLRFPIIEFAQGLTTPYADRLTDVLDFLKPQARAGEKMLTYDSEYPLIFYTPLAIIDGRIFQSPSVLPDWILPRPASAISGQSNAATLPDYLKPLYQEVTITTHDSPTTDNYPEPDFYQYRSSPTNAPFVFYKLKPRNGEPGSK